MKPRPILGSQLAEFAEDKDRLDVLAVHKQGEIVLIPVNPYGQLPIHSPTSRRPATPGGTRECELITSLRSSESDSTAEASS